MSSVWEKQSNPSIHNAQHIRFTSPQPINSEEQFEIDSSYNNLGPQLPLDIVTRILSHLYTDEIPISWLLISRSFYHAVGQRIYRQIVLGYDVLPDYAVVPHYYPTREPIDGPLDADLCAYIRTLAIYTPAMNSQWCYHNMARMPKLIPVIRLYPVNKSYKISLSMSKFLRFHEITCRNLVLRNMPFHLPEGVEFKTDLPRDPETMTFVFNPKISEILKPAVRDLFIISPKKKKIARCWSIPTVPTSVQLLVFVFHTVKSRQPFNVAYCDPARRVKPVVVADGVAILLNSLAIIISEFAGRVTIVNTASFEPVLGKDVRKPTAKATQDQIEMTLREVLHDILKEKHALSEEEIDSRQSKITFLFMGQYLATDDSQGVFDRNEVLGWMNSRWLS